MESYKYKGRVVWLYEFKWTDDYHYNCGYEELDGSFVGTAKDFDEWHDAEQFGQGFGCWDVKRKHATKDQYEDMLSMLG